MISTAATAGQGAGGDEKKSYRKPVRTYGALASEAFFRPASTPKGSRFLRVKKR